VVVMVLERVPATLRRDLTRWMLEIHAGVFVGRLSAIVRERLWQQACSRMSGGAGLLVYQAATEQGFEIRFWNRPARWVEDYDGLELVRTPN
jgi:CRISPR-associated protein Cas2